MYKTLMRFIRRASLFLAAFALMLALAATARAEGDSVSLAGTWRFLRGGPQPARAQGALPKLDFADTIELPGTTDTNKKGPPSTQHDIGGLTQPWRFQGPAWYQRDMQVPAQWQSRRVTLFLERTKYTQVWLDGKPIGDSIIHCTPQEYVLGNDIAPGAHTLTIAVDNKRLPLDVEAHQWSNSTQGNWNGIIGRIELQATDPVWLDDVQAYPDPDKRSVTVKVRLGNSGRPPGKGSVVVAASGEGVAANATRTIPITWTADGGSAEVALPLGDRPALWDEFHPALNELSVKFTGDGGVSDQRRITFGLRSFASRDRQFTINGRTTFLRGKHDGCVFPLTGHPPMELDGWRRYFRVCREYGINHVRFHSWVPPEAAFEAADQMGIYLQAELPFWGDFDQHVKSVLQPEAVAIMRRLGNHPSFVMFSLGNENRGNRDVMASLVSELRGLDPRHLYAQGTNAFMWDPQLPPGDDYLISAKAKNTPDSPSRNVRGANASYGAPDGHVQTGPPNTMTDYSDAIAGMDAPVISHEMGQYTVYPNFNQIAKYTGVSRAYNLERFRQRLHDAGMLDQADDFFHASGALALLCYREEIETDLRTPHFGGFELLDLQDYPGQGTALVGMLDAFMDSKGIVTPQQWRQFCAPTVLLARFPSHVWTIDQTFTAQVEVANYGPSDLPNAVVDWRLKDAHDGIVASNTLSLYDVHQGVVQSMGHISVPLSDIPVPATLTLELQMTGPLKLATSYPLWVFPSNAPQVPPGDVMVVRALDSPARDALAAGRRVLLVADANRPLARTVGGGFATDFWCWPMFHNKPGTMGLLCDPNNPALAGFPTESHSDWQWFDIALHGQPLILDALPAEYRPIVQVIDNLERCHRLGLIFQLKVGAGRLLVCGADLLDLQQSHPEARQLLAGLLRYAASDQFDPQTPITPQALRELLRTTIAVDGTASASSKSSGWPPHPPEQAIDGNDDTEWVAGDVTGDPWWQITFAASRDLHGGEILWDQDRPGYKYIIESSIDGAAWHMLSDQRNNTFPGRRHRLDFTSKGVRAVRITITAVPNNQPTGIREVRFFDSP